MVSTVSRLDIKDLRLELNRETEKLTKMRTDSENSLSMEFKMKKGLASDLTQIIKKNELIHQCDKVELLISLLNIANINLRFHLFL
jgi:hypothetical protein